MKEQIDWITSAQANKYIYDRLAEALLPEGFTEYASLAGTLARAREHHIQMVSQEIRDGETVLRMAVAPMWTCRDSQCFGRYIRLKYDESVAYGRNNYTIIAFKQKTSPRVYYKLDELVHVWDTAILPQIHTEIMDVYNSMDFEVCSQYCEEEDRAWEFWFTDSESRFFTRGYNCLWKRQYEEGKVWIEKAIAETERYLVMLEAWGEQAAPEYLRDMENGRQILEILNRGKTGWEEKVRDRLDQLEKAVLEKKFDL